MDDTLTPLGVSDNEFLHLLVDVIADLARDERQWLPDTATTILEIGAEYGFISATAATTYIKKVVA
jgi:hypothetical protein